MTIPLRLQEAMHRAGIASQSELARRSGVPQPTINRILKGVGRQGPAAGTLRKLAAACNAPLQWLADGTGADPGVSAEKDTVLAMPQPDIDTLFIIPKPRRANPAADAVWIRKVRLRPSARSTGIAGQARSTGIAGQSGEEAGDAICLEKEWLQTRGYDDQLLVAFAMTGESMAPGLYAGDILIINLADRQPSDGAVFVLDYEGIVFTRRLLRDAGSWWLCSDSFEQRRFPRKQYSDDACSLIGRVVYRLSERI